jgi:hypothetical protein
MNWFDTLLISYALDRQGVPFDLIEHFIDALTQGIAAGEFDSIDTRQTLINQAGEIAKSDESETRAAIGAILDHIETRKSLSVLQERSAHLRVIGQILAEPQPDTSFSCRLALRKAARAIEGLRNLPLTA